MPSIVRYQKVRTQYTTITLNEPVNDEHEFLSTELATLDDGYTYVSIPDGVVLPDQPSELTIEQVNITETLRDEIEENSPHFRLVNERVVERIRLRYSIDDEMKFKAVTTKEFVYHDYLSPQESLEREEFYTYRDECVKWGRDQKAVWINLEPLSVEDTANFKYHEIKDEIQDIALNLNNKYSKYETTLFFKQELEAREWRLWYDLTDAERKAKTEPATSVIDNILLYRGDPNKYTLTKYIIDNADVEALMGQAFGIHDSIQNEVSWIVEDSNMTDAEKRTEIDRIDVSTRFAVVRELIKVSKAALTEVQRTKVKP